MLPSPARASKTRTSGSLVGAALVAALAAFPAGARAAGTFVDAATETFNSGAQSGTFVQGADPSADVQLSYNGQGSGLSAPSAPDWMSSSWLYRRAVTINSTNGSALNNYQIKLTLDTQTPITAGRMRSDGGDIRFTAGDGVTPLPYFIESGIDTGSTAIWVSVSTVAAGGNTTVYMYYGNASTTTTSSAASTFIFGDSFTGANGSAPSAANWTGIYTSSTSASTREIESDQLQYSYGSYLSPGYFGLVSNNSFSYASGRRFRVQLQATTIGSGQEIAFNLCNLTSECFSKLGFSGSWLGLTFVDSNPVYNLEKPTGSGIQTLVSNTNTTTGFHQVEYLMTPGAYQVNVDGAMISSGSLTSFTPYIQLVAASNSSAQNNFLFGNVEVGQYSSPEPTQSSVGSEEGAYNGSGVFTSRVFDTGESGTQMYWSAWLSSVPAGASLAIAARADSNDPPQTSWVTLSSASALNIVGRYEQYQASFATGQDAYTAALSSVTLSYGGPPVAPGSPAGVAQSTGSILWTWTDPSPSAFQEQGTRVLNQNNVVLATAPTGGTSYADSGLSPNTQYQRYFQAFNSFGSNGTGIFAVYTLPAAPDITASAATGTWVNGAPTFVFTNAAGFGSGGVDHYLYAFDTSATHSFTGSEPSWASGTLSTSPAASGGYYFHAQSVNASGATNGQVDLGPWGLDTSSPTIPSVSPSSQAWTNQDVSVNVNLADSGGSGLWRARYQFSGTTTPVAGNWSNWDTGIFGNTGQIGVSEFNQGTWYLQVEVQDLAGNDTTGYFGPYLIDLSAPTGSITIDNGAPNTTTTTVTLQLGWADSVSGVSSIAVSNVPGSWTWMAPQSPVTWQLNPMVGVSTVDYEVMSNAGAVTEYQATIVLLSSATSVSAPTIPAVASGDSPLEAGVFLATATLTYGGNGLSNETVSFSFNGANQSGLTNSLGQATTTFAAPSSSGTYALNLSFAGDATYSATAGSGTVVVSQRPITLNAPGINANTNAVFTASVTATDQATGADLVGKSVVFTFQGNSSTVTTNSSGFASATFTAPASPGNYPVAVQFNGSANYASGSQTATLTTAQRATTLAAIDIQTTADTVFNPQAILTTTVGGQPVSGETIVFTFQGSQESVVTNASGVAVATFTAPGVNNLYSYNASFGGDVNYAASSDSPTVAVGFRYTSVVPFNSSVLTLASSSFTAKLLDLAAGSPISDSTLTFVFNGSTVTGVTDVNGLASASFTDPASSGTYQLTVSFSSSGIYVGDSSSGTITVTPRPVLIEGGGGPCVTLDGFQPLASLLDSNFLTGVPGVQLQFSWRGSSSAVTTNASGVAQSPNLGCGNWSGNFIDTVTFAGNATYAAFTSTVVVTAQPRQTIVQPHDATVWALDDWTAGATLIDYETGQEISTRTINFTYQTSSGSAVTNASGLAQVLFPSTPPAGAYQFTASFAGDTTYYAESANGNINVGTRPTYLNISCQNAPVSGPMSCNSVLHDFETNVVVPGATIVYTFGSSSMTAVSDAGGSSTGTFTAPSSTGTALMGATFNGSETYSATTATGTISIVLRPITINVGEIPTQAGQPFTISAQALENYFSNNPVPNRTLSFVFQGTTITATTDGTGTSSATFTAPGSTGTFAYSVSFTGDTTYDPAVSISSVIVADRNANFVVSNVNAYINYPFTVSGTLQDGEGAIVGSTVSFVFQGSTVVATTNGVGVATAAFTAPAATGTYTIYGDYSGSALDSASTTTASIIVSLRPTVLAGQGVTQNVGIPFQAAATLTDFLTGNPVGSEQIAFTFQSVVSTEPTNGSGISSTTFTAPASTGTYLYYAQFNGDTTYAPSYSTPTLTVNLRPSGLVAATLSVAATQVFYAQAQLTDNDTGLGIANSTITFVFEGSTQTAITNSVGVASAPYTAPDSTGTVSYTASYAGSTTYDPSSNTGVVSVKTRASVVVGGNLSVEVNDPIVPSVTVEDGSTGDPLSGETVIFAFGASSATIVTNSFGVATATFSAAASSGSYSYVATFIGDDLYEGSSSTSTVTVSLRRTNMVANPANTTDSNAFTAEATLDDTELGAAVPGTTVYFQFNGVESTATTNSVGVASVTFTAPPSTGSYSYSATFEGTTVYQLVSATATVTVGTRVTELTASNVSVQELDAFTAQATFADEVTGLGIAGKTLIFQFQGSTESAVTSAVGVATVTYSAPASSGTPTFSATFSGDADYSAVSATATVTVNRRDTTLVVANPTYEVNDGISNSATLIDSELGTPVSGRTISFVYQGSTVTANTNGAGVAAAAFPSTGTAGSYPVAASFAGDTTYYISSGGGTVTVEKRSAELATQSVGVDINQTFIATCTATDVESGSAVTGTVLSFDFSGLFVSTMTNALGAATTSYASPASTGSYVYSCALSTSSVYNMASATGTVTVGQRPTSIVTPNVGVEINDVFYATATLTDQLSGAVVAGVPVTLTFNGVTSTITTNAAGQAGTSFTASTAAGSYPLVVASTGSQVYGGSSYQAAVTVNLRGTQLTGGTINVNVNDNLTATDLLKDAETGAGVASMPVTFTFNHSNSAQTTNASGSASAGYTAPGSSGTWNYWALFAGNTTYAAASDTETVNVNPRPTALATVTVTPNASAPFLAQGTLTDIETGNPISGQTVQFYFQSSTQTGTATDGAGNSSTTFVSPPSVGNYNYQATFAGTPVYASSSSAGNVFVQTFASSVTIQALTVGVNVVFTASATLTKVSNGQPQSGDTVDFLFQGVSSAVVTNANGWATATYTAPGTAGNYVLQASYGGSAGLASSTNTANINVTAEPTILAAGANMTAYALNVFLATATLTDANTLLPVPGKSVNFAFISQSTNDITNASGVSTGTLTATSTGTWSYLASWAGDSNYGGSSTQAVITVLARPDSLTAQNEGPVYTLSTFVATAAFVDSITSAPIVGQTIDFLYPSPVGSYTPVLTNAVGVATATISVGSSSGTIAYAADFSATGVYAGAAASTNTVVVLPRPVVVSTAAVNVHAGDVFVASATLTDGLSGQPIADQTVWFSYDGGALVSATTNGVGLASTTLDAGSAPGAFNLAASYSANATYAANSSTAVVTVSQNRVFLSTANITVFAANTFISSATLTDITGAPIAGKTIVFDFSAGGSSSSVTNPEGLATVTYTAPTSSGAYSYSSVFPGDSTYAAGSSTATVTVNPRPVFVSTPTATLVAANDVFAASATVTDALTGAGLGAATVWFDYYNGGFVSTTTNAAGYAQLTQYNAGSSSGSYTISATFPATPEYAANRSSATVLVQSRQTVVSTPTATAFYALSPLVSSATVTDVETGAGVGGLTLSFHDANNGFVSTTTSNNAGLVGYGQYSAGGYTTGASSGPLSVSATFPGNGTYGLNYSTTIVTINPRPTALSTATAISVYANTVFTASTTLTDGLSGAGINGQTVWFDYYNGGFVSTGTGASGYAQLTQYNSGLSSGTYTLSATLSSNPTYVGNYSSTTVTVLQRPIVVSTANISVYANNVFTASATLTDGLTGLPVNNGTVWFYFQGTWQSATSNASGLASYAGYVEPDWGSYPLSATYAAGPEYLANSSTATITVNPRPVVVSTAAVTVYAGNAFVSSATLTDGLTGAPIGGGRTIWFNYQNGAGTEAGTGTNAQGYSSYSSYAAGITAGSFGYSSTFAGDVTYGANSATATVTVQLRPTVVSTAAATSVYALSAFTSSATLTDFLTGQPLNGLPLVFGYKGTYDTPGVNTNGSGYAQDAATFNSGSPAGAQSFSATFPGNTEYAANSATATVNVQVRPTAVSTPTAAAFYTLGTFVSSATLTDALSGQGLNGVTLWFNYYNGGSQSATTQNAPNAGYASYSSYNTGTSSGTYDVSATFAGNATYGGNYSTTTVTINPRPTAVSAATAISVYANTVFVASTTLTDGLSGGGIGGQTVWFNFSNASVSTATNVSGYAQLTQYNSGTSSGTYQLSATLPSNPTYVGSASSTTVTVLQRPIVVSTANVTVYANNVFIASATLTDGLTGQPVNNGTVWFNFQNSWQSATTNSSGLASYTGYSTGTWGSYQMSASYAATAEYLANSSTATISVNARPVVVSTAAVTAYAGNTFISSATLTDFLSGAPIGGRVISFNYQNGAGVEAGTAGNAQGLSTYSSYAAGTTAGGFSYSSTFAGDATYGANSSTAAVTVTLRPTVVSTAAATNVYALTAFTSSATVTDLLTGAPISNLPIVFGYKGTYDSPGVNSNAGGYAQDAATFNSGSPAGTQSFSATFPGNAEYAANSATATVNVLGRPVVVSTANVTAYVNNVFVASATLTDGISGAVVGNKTLWFNFQNVAESGVTSVGAGLAQYGGYEASANGSYNLSASFPGDGTYLPNSSTATITVQARPTVVSTTTAITVYANNVFVASTTLTDFLTGAPISGQTIWFDYYNGGFISTTTNASGYAQLTQYNAGLTAGSYTLSATFSPTAAYVGNSSSMTVTVLQRPIVVSTANITVYADNVFTASATLTDGLTGQPINGGTVWFNFQNSWQSATTNSSGLASFTGYSTGTWGSYQLSATYPANGEYLANSSTAAVTVQARPVAVSTAAVTVAAGANFVSSATLTDLLTGAPIGGGRIIWFNYQNGAGTKAGTGTNAQGYSSYSSYAAGATAGGFSYSSTYAGDATYGANSSTAGVTVTLRPVVLSTAAISTFVNSVFIASSTLTDGLTGAPVAGKIVSFSYFNGGAQNGTTAAGTGLASYNGYNAGASAGNFSYSSTFAGDSEYSAISATAAVTVQARPSVVSTAAVTTVYVNNVFVASTTLTDGVTGAPVSAATIGFLFAGSASQQSTNAGGYASASYGAPGSSGTYTYSSTFAGTAAYSANSATATVVAQPRPIVVSTASLAVYAENVFTASATLTDGLTGLPVNNKTVWFDFQGSLQSALTNAAGLASYTGYSTGTWGSYSLLAYYLPDAVYLANSSTATITVNARPIVVSTASLTVYTNTVFIASSTLTDGLTGLPVSGRTAWFTYGGSSASGASNAQGLASYNGFNSGLSSGTYSMPATFEGDSTYLPASSTATITVNPQPPTLSAEATTAPASTVFVASATLTAGAGAIVGQTVWFNFGGSSSASVTDAGGLATVTYTAPASSGTYPFSATFSGNGEYAAESSTANLTVSPRATVLAGQSANVYALNVFTATATLTDQQTDADIANATIQFSYNGSNPSGTTGVNGQATTTFTAAASSGTYSYTAAYGGNATYASSNISAPITINPRPTSISVTTSTVFVSNVFIATATVTDLLTDGPPVAGQTVDFVLNGTTVTATTGANGQATASLTAPATPGTYAVQADLPANATYLASLSSGALTAITRPTYIVLSSATAAAEDQFTMSATLYDGIANTGLSGQSFSFQFQGSTQTATTNGLGQATTTFFAPTAAGSYASSAFWNGNASYSASTAASTVGVTLRPTNIAATNLTTTAGVVFTATGTLTDVETGNPVVAVPVAFQFNNGVTLVNNSATTNGIGVADSTFTAPSGTGLYTYTAKFNGNSTYAVSTTSGFVQIGLQTTLVAADVTTQVLSIFSMQAKLIDQYSQPISSKTITFVFQGSTETAQTNSSGVASSTFTAPTSSGAYVGQASYAGDSIYAPSASNANVTVTLRTTTMAAFPETATVGTPVTVQSKLTDASSGLGVSSETVVFAFLGSTQTAATNSSGVATATFTAVDSSGTYSFTAAFAGDSTYQTSNDTSTVTVASVQTTLIVDDDNVEAGDSFAATAKLVSLADGDGVADSTITFVVNGATQTALTDALGDATTTYAAPAASGTYVITASFAGTGGYGASSSYGTLTDTLRATSLAEPNASAYAEGVLTASATLTDVETSAGVGQSTISFVFDGSTQTALTNGAGLAVATFTATVATGTYSLAASYAGTSTYQSTAAVAQAAINIRPTSLGVPAIASASNAVFTASATLTDLSVGAPMSGVTVSFLFQGSTETGVTNAFGLALSTYMAPASSGTYALVATFAGTTEYAFAQTSTIVQVSSGSGSGNGSGSGSGGGTVLSVADAETQALTVFTASATLTLTNGTVVPGKSIQLDFQGSTQTIVTNAFGVATATFTAPASSGSYALDGTWAGDGTYNASSGSGTVTVSQIPTEMTAATIITSTGAVFIATATLTISASSAPISAQSLSFVFLTSTETALTNSLGVGATDFFAPASSGSYVFEAEFAGNATYGPSSALGTVLVNFGSAGGSGSPGGPGVGTNAAKIAFLTPQEHGVAGSPFTVDAWLEDTNSGAGISGRSIQFTFQGTPQTEATDGTGHAQATFTAPATLGLYGYTAYFAGDSTYTAVSGSNTVAIGLGLQPADPTLISIATSNAVNTTITWSTVTLSVSGSNIASELVGYQVQSSTNLNATWTDVSFVSTNTTSLVVPTAVSSATTVYYRALAQTIDYFDSPGLTTLKDSGGATIGRAYISYDNNAWIDADAGAVAAVDPTGTGAGRIILATATTNNLLAAYDLEVEQNGVVVPNFTFGNVPEGVNLTISIDRVAQAQAQSLGAKAAAAHPADGTALSLFYYSGVQWVDLGGTNNEEAGTVTLNLRRTGQFGVNFAPQQTSFALTSVSPRIFSPNSSNSLINRAIFTLSNPNGDEVVISIYDVTGAKIKSALPEQVSGIQFYWDGTNDKGTIVPGGAYVYQIQDGSTVKTGVVVVAK